MEIERITATMLQSITHPSVMAAFVVVFLTLLLSYVASRLLLQLERHAAATRSVWDDALIKAARQPFTMLIWVLGIAEAAGILVAEAHATLSILGQLIDPARSIAVVGLLTLFLTRFVFEAEQAFIKGGTDHATAAAIGKLLRASIIITAVLSILQTLGVSISGVLAFGGIGGLAVGFAAKDLLTNFLGGLMIYLDRPFAVGDWVRSPDREIEGTVEHIGWRLTIIRTFDQRPLYVPNSIFANVAVENPSRMKNRRIKETIGLRYQDADKLEAIVVAVREMLAGHPDIDTSRTLMVNFNAFADSALEFFVYTFTRTTVWTEFHQIKEDILFEIIRIVERHGAGIAFPTRTLHLPNAPALPTPDTEPDVQA